MKYSDFVCLQGGWLYILWDGCRSAAIPWLHRGGRAPPHLQVTGWVTQCQTISPWQPQCFTIPYYLFGWMCKHTVCLVCCDDVTLGTPTEENWPGISSSEEFKSYNFPKYKPQPLINHTPRYSVMCVYVCGWGPYILVCTFVFVFGFFLHMYTVMVCVCTTGRKSCGTFQRWLLTSFLPWGPVFPSASAAGRQ